MRKGLRNNYSDFISYEDIQQMNNNSTYMKHVEDIRIQIKVRIQRIYCLVIENKDQEEELENSEDI